MTTPRKGPAAKRKAPSPSRKKRPPVARAAADRSGVLAAEEAARSRAERGNAEEPANRAKPPPHQSDTQTIPVAAVDEAIADAVKSGYDTLAQSIAQGREAAARFRQGQYNMRDVPGDVESVARRFLDLARQLSATTFDLCEDMLGQIGKVSGGPPPPGEVAAGLPAFRDLEPVRQDSGRRAASSADEPRRMEAMPLATVFSGGKATCLTRHLARPEKPTSAEHLTAAPLHSRRVGTEPITDVRFEVDLSKGGLIARVTIPDKQEPGIYAGQVFAAAQDIPLGTLVIRVEG